MSNIQEQYLEWVSRWATLGELDTKTDEGRKTYNDIIEGAINFVADVHKKDNQFIYSELTRNLANPDLYQLRILVECIRSGYLLEQPLPGMLKLLLEIAFKLLDRIIENNQWTQYIMQVYDIVFHQHMVISKEEEELYFQLTSKLLDKQFQPLWDNSYYYEMVVYFILLTEYWSEGEKERFMTLWNKMQFVRDNSLGWDHLVDDWQESFNNYNEGKETS